MRERQIIFNNLLDGFFDHNILFNRNFHISIKFLFKNKIETNQILINHSFKYRILSKNPLFQIVPKLYLANHTKIILN